MVTHVLFYVNKHCPDLYTKRIFNLIEAVLTRTENTA